MWISHRAEVREKWGSTWISMEPRSLALRGLAKPNRMRFRYVRAHYENTVAVGEVPLVISSRAAAKRGAQTGHRCAVSYSGPVLDREHPKPAIEQFFD